jgi:hypothetical protein
LRHSNFIEKRDLFSLDFCWFKSKNGWQEGIGLSFGEGLIEDAVTTTCGRDITKQEPEKAYSQFILTAHPQ